MNSAIKCSSDMIDDSDCLRAIGSGRKYSTPRRGSNTDPWVAQALKSFDRELYDSAYGFTRRGGGVAGMYTTLSHYSGDIIRFSDLSAPLRMALLQAKNDARVAFSVDHTLEPIDWDEAINSLNLSTSAGISFVGKKRDNLPAIRERARFIAHFCKWQTGEHFTPSRVKLPECKGGFRGHLSPRDDPKTRLVWIYPAEILAIEAKFAVPLYEYYKARISPMMTGRYPSQEYSILGRPEVPDDVYVGLDFSKFDATVPAFLVHWAFDILHRCFHWDVWRGKALGDNERMRWLRLWEAVEWYFTHTPIVMPDGKRWRKHRGVPSGSFFTQVIDSVVNYIVIKALCYMQKVPCWGMRVLGDDSGFATTPEFDLDLAQIHSSQLGMTLNSAKSQVVHSRSELVLLGFNLTGGFRTLKDPMRWFHYALYPERCPQSLSESWSRIIGLVLSGGSADARFSEFATYYQSGYPLSIDCRLSANTMRFLTFGLGLSEQSLLDAGFSHPDPSAGWTVSVTPTLWLRSFTLVT